MKIGIEGQRLFRKKKHGMDFVALELIRNLQKLDRENEYFVFVKPDEDVCLEDSENFHIIGVEGKGYPVWEQISLPSAAKKYGCELLHCTSNTAPVKPGMPLMVTIHDIIYLESLSILNGGGTMYQKFGNLYRRWNVPRIAGIASAITTVSRFEKDTMEKRFPELSSKIHAVYNGVSEHFGPVSDKSILEEVRKKYGLPQRFIFYLGNTDPKKNTPNVIKAFNLYVKSVKDPLPLVVIDFGKDVLEKLVKNTGNPDLMKHIVVSDYIQNTDLPSIYSQSDLFLYPSLRESFGIPMLEAMKCGVPVVTSNTSSMPEVASDAACFADPFSPEDIAEKISLVLNDLFYRKALIEKGFQRANEFSWQNMAIEMKKLYSQILNN